MNYEDYNNYDYEYETELDNQGNQIKFRISNDKKIYSGQDYIFGKKWCGLSRTKFIFMQSSYYLFFKTNNHEWPEKSPTYYYSNLPTVDVYANISLECPNCGHHNIVDLNKINNSTCDHCGIFFNIHVK